MTFMYGNYWPVIVLFILLMVGAFRKSQKMKAEIIKTYWGFSESFLRKVSIWIMLVSFSLLSLVLLDMRGEGEKLKANMAREKTVILIDASASMLSDDVRPNRFQKSIFLARHFIRKAVGHEVSVILFSDTHRKLVPFTSDLDLLDGRLEALMNNQLSRGGTGLSLAIAESANYLRVDKKKYHGNILLFTDGEENQDFLDLKISDDINVAVVGVGTKGGARIPMKSVKGDFQGYMKFGGKEVISSLDEKSIRNIGSRIKHFKYWLVNSYSLPTDNILKFFQDRYKAKEKEGEVLIRPTLFPWFVIPALCLFLLYLVMNWGRQFIILPTVVLLMAYSSMGEEKKVQALDEFDREKISRFLERVKKGEASKKEKLLLAEEILKSGEIKKANTIYSEVSLQSEKINPQNKEIFVNWATSSLFSGERALGLDRLSKVENLEKDKENPEQEILKTIKINRYLALKKEHKKQKEEKKKKQKKKKDKNKEDKKQEDKSGEGENKKNKNGEKGKQDQKENKEDQKKDQKDQSGDQDSGEDQKDKDSKKNDQEKLTNKPSEKKLSKKKMSAVLKQLLSDDKELQRRLLNTKTRKRSREKLKNW